MKQFFFRLFTVLVLAIACTLLIQQRNWLWLCVIVPSFLVSIGWFYRLYTFNTRKIAFLLDAIENDDPAVRFYEHASPGDSSMVNVMLNRIARILYNVKQETAQREKYYELIMDFVETGIVVLNSKGSVYQKNKEAMNLLGLDVLTHIYSREILSESLEDYTGTILVVSHDRNFLDCVVNNIYEVKKDGAELFKGDYNSYLNQREEVKEKDIKASLNFEEQKRNKNRMSSLEKKIIKAESDVEKLEEKKSAKEEEYNKAGIENNVDKLMEIQKELEELDMEILSLMEEWEELENELKTLKNTF